MAGPRRWRTLVFFAALFVFLFWRLVYSSRTHGGPGDPYGQVNLNPKAVVWTKHPDRYPVTSYRSLPTIAAAPADNVKVKVKIPAVQSPSRLSKDGGGKGENQAEKATRQRRLAAVRNSFKHSWAGYKARAWLHDEVMPISGGWRDPFGGWAATLVDALDTLWIMDLHDEFGEAVKAVQRINFTTTTMNTINVFETTIRYLGGFLAAYELSEKKYPALLDKAVEVGELLMCAFDTPNRLPATRWLWQNYVLNQDQVSSRSMLSAEIGSLSLEFTKLSQLTAEPKYYDAVQRISDTFASWQDRTRMPGMWPVVVDAQRPAFDTDNSFTLGGMSDSLYEYLPKQYLLLGGALRQPRDMYESFIGLAKSHLFRRAMNEHNLTIVLSGDARVVGDPKDPDVISTPKMQHLTCFTGGMVALADRIFSDSPTKNGRSAAGAMTDLELARALTDGCVWAYDSTAAGVGPEMFSYVACAHIDDPDADAKCVWSEAHWREEVGRFWRPVSNKGKDRGEDSRGSQPGPATGTGGTKTLPEATDEQVDAIISSRRLPKGMTNVQDAKYLLRPETVESVFILHRITGEPEWMDKAWRLFDRIDRLTRTKYAAASLDDVTKDRPAQVDNMESFWLAETLKYFYLVFADWDVVNLDEWVLNTEAHPLRRMG